MNTVEVVTNAMSSKPSALTSPTPATVVSVAAESKDRTGLAPRLSPDHRRLYDRRPPRAEQQIASPVRDEGDVSQAVSVRVARRGDAFALGRLREAEIHRKAVAPRRADVIEVEGVGLDHEVHAAGGLVLAVRQRVVERIVAPERGARRLVEEAPV
jgi:hypothetical protein